MSAQHRDTAAVVRQLGWRGVAAALLRRAGSEMRALGRVGTRRLPASAPEFAAALRRAPSLVSGVAPIASPALVPGDDADPRLRWEIARGRALVASASRREPGFEAELVAFLARPAENDPLETALRVWNLGVAASLHGLAALGDEALRALAAHLVDSARFVESHLEDRGLIVGSHLVGELLALQVCGLFFQGVGSEAAAWSARAHAGLAREARVQVLPDGGGAEGSSGYGRFVAELWLAALSCDRAAGVEPSPAVAAAARAMLTHLADTLPPDGGDLGIGDDDSSIVLPGATDVASIVPLLALWPMSERPAGISFSRVAEIIGGAEARSRWESAPVAPRPPSVWARDFGVAVARRGRDMLVLRAGPHGQSGVGGHAHNDALSVSIWFDGRRVVDDPGTGLYLGRPALRERFRGVAAHATVCVDGLEPSELPPTRPFALPDATRARIVTVEDRADSWRAVAEHVGYLRTGVRVRREVRLDRATGAIQIIDTLSGTGTHRVDVSFPLTGAGPVTLDDHGVTVGDIGLRDGAADGEGAKQMAGRLAGRLAWRLDEGARSPRYGKIEPAVVARRSGRIELPVTLVTTIARTR